MFYCKKCGKELHDGAKFCNRCGAAVVAARSEEKPIMEERIHTEREKTYVGKIHKCPNCGEVLTSFVSTCPLCGVEFRDADSSSAMRDFSEKYERAGSVASKIALVRSFPVPNTKEDIIEFMILACTNFDAEYYATHLGVEDPSDAWLAKIEQCYKKASIVFPDEPEFARIANMYNGIHVKIERAKNSKGEPAAIAAETKSATSTAKTVASTAASEPSYRAGAMFFVCLFFGYFGVHKFMEGKNGIGVVYLLTMGLFGFGWFIDCIAYLGKMIK